MRLECRSYIGVDAAKNGQDVGVIAYEISADGRTLTQKYSGSPDQTLVFERAGSS
jgi:hypothetical protein